MTVLITLCVLERAGTNLTPINLLTLYLHMGQIIRLLWVGVNHFTKTTSKFSFNFILGSPKKK